MCAGRAVHLLPVWNGQTRIRHQGAKVTLGSAEPEVLGADALVTAVEWVCSLRCAASVCSGAAAVQVPLGIAPLPALEARALQLAQARALASSAAVAVVAVVCVLVWPP